MLEVARLRIRKLVRFVEKTARNSIYTDFEDELGDSTDVALPGITPGTNFEQFRAKAAAYLKQHETTSRCNGCAATSSSPPMT